MGALLDSLTLRPCDTDREHFAAYTPAQLDWCRSSECEALQLAVYERFTHRKD